MSRRTLRIQWISIGSALALLAAASLTGGLLLQHAGNSVGESLVLLGELLLAFSAASFVVLAVALTRWRPLAATGAPVSKRSRPTRTVSKLSRYIRGTFQGLGAFVLLIVGLLVLARGSKAGIVVIAIGVVFGVAAVTSFWLAERTSRAGAIARSAGRPKD
jgi:uncharacterized membrane protein